MMAFYVQRSSDGSLCDLQMSLSLGLDKNSINANYSLYLTLLLERLPLQTEFRSFL